MRHLQRAPSYLRNDSQDLAEMARIPTLWRRSISIVGERALTSSTLKRPIEKLSMTH